MSQQINLFNPVFLKQKKQFSARAMAQGLAMTLLGGIAVAVVARFQVESLHKRQEETNAQLTMTQAQLAKVTADYPPRQKSPGLEAEAGKADAELRGLQRMLDIVKKKGMGNEQGYAPYFAAFARQIVNGLWLTGFQIAGAGSDIELRGRTLRPELVPEYLNRLKQEPVLRGKTFAALAITVPTASAGGVIAESPVKPNPAVPYVEFTLRSSGFNRDPAGESTDAINKSGAAAGGMAGPPRAIPDTRGGKGK